MGRFLTPAKSALAAVVAIGVGSAAAQTQLRPVLELGEKATRDAERAQDRINQLDDERSDLVREYRTVLQRTDAAKLFAAQQERVVASQEREIESLESQLGRVDEITAQMIPMMIDMIDQLERFVEADIPFRKALRTERIATLRAALDDPQVPPPEAYRLIIEAYQAEMEYGSTVNTWQDTITNANGDDVTVDYFQYGRVALVYVTPDGRAQRWRRDTSLQNGGEWVDIPSSYVPEIRSAISIAEGKAQQAVMFAPVEKFEVSQ